MNSKQKARRRARRRRRLALLLERPPKIIQVVCAISAFVFALEAGIASLSLVNNGRESIGGGTGIVRACTRDPATGWLMYRCDLAGSPAVRAGEPVLSRERELKALKRPHGTIAFEIRKTAKGKAGQGYVTVEAGTPRHSTLLQMVVLPVFIAAFFVVFVLQLRLLRLAARAVRPRL